MDLIMAIRKHGPDQIRAKLDEIHTRFQAKIERLKKGDELPPVVIKMVKKIGRAHV